MKPNHSKQGWVAFPTHNCWIGWKRKMIDMLPIPARPRLDFLVRKVGMSKQNKNPTESLIFQKHYTWKKTWLIWLCQLQFSSLSFISTIRFQFLLLVAINFYPTSTPGRGEKRCACSRPPHLLEVSDLLDQLLIYGRCHLKLVWRSKCPTKKQRGKINSQYMGVS